jgi:hypothetical protein
LEAIVGSNIIRQAVRAAFQGGSVALLTIAALPLHAQEATTPALAAEAGAPLDVVIVTGSAGTGKRTKAKASYSITTLRAGGERAMMGDSLRAPAGASVKFALRVVRAEGAQVVVLLDGEPAALLKDGRVGSDDAQQDFSWTSDGKRHWLRVDVRSVEEKLLLLGNHIYLN